MTQIQILQINSKPELDTCFLGRTCYNSVGRPMRAFNFEAIVAKYYIYYAIIYLFSTRNFYSVFYSVVTAHFLVLVLVIRLYLMLLL